MFVAAFFHSSGKVQNKEPQPAIDALTPEQRFFIAYGQVWCENARPEDLPVNPCKAKHLTNMRSQGDGKGIQLEAPLKMTLERAIEYISADEYVEVTPKSLRLRKRVLDATARGVDMAHLRRDVDDGSAAGPARDHPLVEPAAGR